MQTDYLAINNNSTGEVTMKISDKQKAANKRNAKRSTGPRTRDGKERSSMNALKHGICQTSPLVNSTNLEELKLHDKIYLGLLERWDPQV
jgi:hypothetical protein